jgi:hypothetical protein
MQAQYFFFAICRFGLAGFKPSSNCNPPKPANGFDRVGSMVLLGLKPNCAQG